MTIDKCDRCKQTSDTFYVYGNKKTELCFCPRCNHKLRRVIKDYYATNKLDSLLPWHFKFALSPEEKEPLIRTRSNYQWKNEDKFFAYLKAHPWSTAKEIAKAIGNTGRTVIQQMPKYLKKGTIIRRRNLAGDARAYVYFYIGDDK